MEKSWTALCACILAALAVGCSGEKHNTAVADSGTNSDLAPYAACDQDEDADGDSINDCWDRSDHDFDKDGKPNSQDDDSDDDGIPDSEEAGDHDPSTPPTDTDGDGQPDFLDVDSDNDGLTDAEEKQRGSDWRNEDSDQDGLPDLAEEMAGTDPTDALSKLDSDEFFVILPYEGDHVRRDLLFGTSVRKADVYFLMDTTTSMNGEIANIQSSLKSVIVPGLAKEIPDVAMGVGHFEDMPFQPHGSDDFHVYENLQNLTTDSEVVQQALDGLRTCCTQDGITMPEGQVPALHATITGTGLGPYYPAAQTCPTAHFGYPCFRPDALPVIILVTDAAFHNGPSNANPYPPLDYTPPTYDQAVAALNTKGAKVLGIFSGTPTDQAHIDQVVTDTGSVDSSGKALTFRINADGSDLSTAMVDAVKALANDVPRDVDTRHREYPAVDDGIEASDFIKAVTPKSADPATGFKRKDETTFYGTEPGTRVTFELDFLNDFVKPTEVDQAFRVVIEVRGDGGVLLDSRRVIVIVPRVESSLGILH